MLTRKHAQAIADIIKPHVVRQIVDSADDFHYQRGSIDAAHDIALDLFDMLKADNPRMDRQRFMDACGLDRGSSVP